MRKDGTPMEIAALALAVQEQQGLHNVKMEIDRVDFAKAAFGAIHDKIPED